MLFNIDDDVVATGNEKRRRGDDPSVDAGDPELEVQDAVRFPAGVYLPVEALAPPPPVALVREFDRDISASVVRNREFVGLRDVEEWGRLQAAIIQHKGR